MDYFARRIAYLKKTYSLENGLQIDGLAPTKETTLEEVSERFRQSQEQDYKESFAAKTNYKNRKFGLAIILR
jgi:hypothetical protein